MLICFEGLDGVGKSTIAREISQILDLRLVERPIKSLLDIGEEQSGTITERLYSSYSSNLQAMYYLMGYLSALEDSKREDIIFDRGLLSTYYFSFNDMNSFLFDALVNNCGSPDLTIILYASIEERLRRIRARDSSDKDLDKRRLYVDGYIKYFEGVERYKLSHYLINTENLNKDEVLVLCQRLVRAYLKGNPKNQDIQELLSIKNIDNLSKMSYDDLNRCLGDYLPQEGDSPKEYSLRKGMNKNNERINNK
ncbi:MAG: AAA family ATPase [Bacilli bacterium]|nr:AAA family ATPase [Bacilli bacterium]